MFIIYVYNHFHIYIEDGKQFQVVQYIFCFDTMQQVKDLVGLENTKAQILTLVFAMSLKSKSSC